MIYWIWYMQCQVQPHPKIVLKKQILHMDEISHKTVRFMLLFYGVVALCFLKHHTVCHLWMFSINVWFFLLQLVEGCNKEYFQRLPPSIPIQAHCHVKSDKQGNFVFESLPCGKYRLVCGNLHSCLLTYNTSYYHILWAPMLKHLHIIYMGGA